MFTDIVGFTALAQSDEAAAMQLLEDHRSLLRPIFAQHGGREVKTMGDGFLVEFDSALEATRCAVAIQEALRAGSAAGPGDAGVRVRIGVHLGDVIRSDGDILGDAVNVASRLEPLAEPGGICISEPVHGQVANKLPLEFRKLEAAELKNVEMPLAVYRVRTRKEPVVAERRGPGGAPVSRRIAVLPFTNMSPDPQDEYFSDGLTEEMITELSLVPHLEVIARTSVMRYKRASKSIREVGHELGVDVALEGSVRRAGSRLRVTAQLVDARTEGHLWADRFDRELTDIFAVQTEIARQVAVRLGARWVQGAGTAPALSGDLDAYFLYLRGRALWSRRTEPSVREALTDFEKAVARDPTFAAAYSGVADCWIILSSNFETVPWRAVEGKAREAARKALALDDALAEAHATLGLIAEHEFDWEENRRELLRALELNPNYATARFWRFRGLAARGEMAAAKAELERAAALDPLSPVVTTFRALLAASEGRSEEAVRIWDELLELEPSFVEYVPMLQTAALLRGGRASDAGPRFARMEASWGPRTKGWEERLGWVPAAALALAGRTEEARASLARLIELSEGTYVEPTGVARVYACLGEPDGFLLWAGRGLEEHTLDFPDLRLSPLFERVRGDPRVADLYRRAGLPP